MSDHTDDTTESPGGEPDAGHTEEHPTLVYTPLESTPTDADADSEADEEWVVRATGGIRLALPVAALLAVLLVAAGFWGGALVEKNHGGGSGGGSAASLAARFRGARGGGTSTTGGGFSGFGGLGGGSSSATTGTVSVVDGKTLYVLTSGGSLVKVTLSSSTTITRNADSTPVDLRPGDTVVVQGATGSNGSVTATSVAATAPGVSSTSSLFGGAGGGGSTPAATTTSAG